MTLRKWITATALAGVLLSTGASVSAQDADDRKHLLVLGGSDVFAHDSVSHAMFTMAKIGERTGLFDVRFRTDMELMTKQKLRGNRKNLDYFDAVMFYTQGDLKVSEEQKADLMRFVKEDGKAILAVHSGTDSFRETWPEYIDMVGGAFINHPWHQKIRVRVEDRTHPISRHFPAEFEITDEIYQVDRYDRSKVRVLMGMDTSSVDMTKKGVQRTDGDFALAWVREFGKGRVFTCLLGHRPEVWDNPDIQKMWLEAFRWAVGITNGESASLPLPTDDD
ncbi:MAG: ThuA domain-containing protein [Bryobacterales bacterium]|nr:ThuA domain-containing protein [Bryobacterales bacterium]